MIRIKDAEVSASPSSGNLWQQRTSQKQSMWRWEWWLTIEASNAGDLPPCVLHQLMIPSHFALSPNFVLTCLLWKPEAFFLPETQSQGSDLRGTHPTLPTECTHLSSSFHPIYGTWSLEVK